MHESAVSRAGQRTADWKFMKILISKAIMDSKLKSMKDLFLIWTT